MGLSSSKYYTIAAFGLVALAIAITPVLPRASKARREAQVINQTHYLTKCLETYVSDFGTFPESLEVMLAKQRVDNEVLHLGKGETIEYLRPKTNDPDAVSILVIHGDGFRIDINRDFERRVTHSGANKEVNP